MTSLCLQESFVSEMPKMERMAKGHFSHLDADAKEEAVQNTLGLCWKAACQLLDRGRQDVSLGNVLWYSVKQTKSGRMPQGCPNAKDALDQRGRRVEFEEPDLNHYIGKSTPVPDAVVFRVDVPQFMETRSERQNRMANDFMAGDSTAEVAEKQRRDSGSDLPVSSLVQGIVRHVL